MAELIQRTDSLNTGREKLNNAIKAFNETVVEGDSSVEAAQARVDEKGRVHPTLKARIDDGFEKTEDSFNSVNQQLAQIDHQKADKSEVRERTDKAPIRMNELHTEVKQAFTGGAVAVVGYNAVGRENLKPSSVSIDKLSFTVNSSINLFDGRYFNGVLFSNTSTDPQTLIPVYDYGEYTGKTAIIPVQQNKTYGIKIFEPHKSNRFRLGLSVDYPTFQEKGDDLTVSGKIPEHYYKLDTTVVTLPHNRTEILVESGQHNYIVLYVDGEGNEPLMSVTEGAIPTEFVSGSLIPDKFIEKNIDINDLTFTTTSDNLFDGRYFNGVLFSNTSTDPQTFIPVYDYGNLVGRVAIVPIKNNRYYSVKVFEPEKSNRFRAGLSYEHPTFQEKGDDLTIGGEVPEHYYKLDKSLISNNNLNEYTFYSENYNYLSVYVSSIGEEPLLQVSEGEIPDKYTSHLVIDPRYIGLQESSKGRIWPAEVAKEEFIAEMNRYAERIGMTNSNFVEPAGFPSTEEHVMTTRDMLKMAIQASGYKELARVWNKKTYTFQIAGGNAREMNVDTTVTHPSIEDEYHIFGGKTGRIGGSGPISGHHLVLITDAPNGEWFVGAVRKASSDIQRFEQLRVALDNAKALLEDPNASIEDVDAESASVALMPKHNPFSYEQYDIPLIYSKNPDMPGHPASVTKVMSAMILLDNLHFFENGIDEKVEIQSVDITSGTGPTFYEGDIITLRDALYCMMLPSSNTATHVVARVVGNKLLNIKDTLS